LYELGTFFIGVLIGATVQGEFFDPLVLLFALYFLFPANLLIYGINDIFDYETDMLNPKKTGYEDVLAKDLHPLVFKAIFATNILFMMAVFSAPLLAIVTFALFIFFATFYSAPPIRAKARPFFDSFFSAGHYIATGAFGYFLVGGEGSVLLPVVAGMAWAIAMHAYSAVPDIKADGEASLATIATTLKSTPTIWLCFALYTVSAYIAFLYIGFVAILLYIPYALMMTLSLRADEVKLMQLYKYFPTINALVGMAIFFALLFGKGWL
jgi:4-hydroxybenzoate polyprenyltransferase